MKKIIPVLSITSIVLILLSASISAEDRGEKSPHADALMLVLSTQGDMIRKVDKENWWFDVKERSWSVRRPFGPGVLDSTHMFVVTYSIGGKKLASWNVDTDNKTVKPASVKKSR